MKQLSDLVDEYVKRPVVAMPPAVSVARAKREFGLESVIKMCSNENPLGVSPKAAEAMRRAVDEACFYADPEPENALKAKVAASLGLAPKNVMITSGAAFALNFIGEAFIQPGDECILSSPTYPPYYSIIQKNGGRVVDVPMTKKLEFDLEGILKAIGGNTKLIFVCNPCNPTGRAVYRDELARFAAKVPEDVILVFDEAYVQFAKSPCLLTMVPEIASRKNVIVVQTFSKLYGLAGIRVGYAAASEEVITYMQRESIARSLNVVGIDGAIAAMDDVEFARKTVENNASGRDYLTREFARLGYEVYPSEANFVYVDFRADPKEVARKILPYGIIIRGDFPFLRISIGTLEQNERIVRAIEKAL